ncbi:hypothetical protein D3C71_1601950 [compost metagenome]
MFDFEHGQGRVGAQRLVQMFAHTAAARKLDNGMPHDVAQPHPALRGKRMVSPAHQEVAVGMQELAIQVRHVRAAGRHREIDLSALHHVQAGIQQPVAQVQHDAGMRLAEAGQQTRQPTGRQRRQRRQRHAAAAAGGMVAQVFHDKVHIRQQAASGGVQHSAFGRQFHMSRVAVEQLQAGAVFQRTDQRAERRLRQVAALRGAREMPFVRQRDESAQLPGR